MAGDGVDCLSIVPSQKWRNPMKHVGVTMTMLSRASFNQVDYISLERVYTLQMLRNICQ